MSNADFIGLVQSIHATAEAALGEFSPVQNSVREELGGVGTARGRMVAERSLRVLRMLVEKTRGNLDLTESTVLGDAVRDLQERLRS